MKKYLYIISLISSSLLIFSCGDHDKKVVIDTSPAIEVKVSQVKDHNNPFLSVNGKIQASNSASLSTKMMGYVDKVYVKVGDKVTNGQLLISINNIALQAQKAQVNARITQAEVAFNNAKKNYNRFTNLFASNSVTQKEMDDMTANYEIAKAALESANQMKNEMNAQLAYSNITAPFSGVITSKNVEVGDMANPGASLISIEKPKDFEVIAMVPETEISLIKKGFKVTVLIKSIDENLKGNVSEVSTSAKNTGGQYLVKINILKSTANLLSGMFATVQFPIEKTEKTSLTLLSKESLIIKGQLSGVYTVSQNNTAILRWLRLGRTFGNQVEVLSGLSKGESYIVSAKGKLFNGAKVTIQ
tara:strand:- start:3813 stop:4889 length:1077 start_codon:yes stop_codon:yes gene_type:complete